MGLKLKIKRIEKGLKQKDLVNKVGVSQQYIGDLESGRSTNPTREVMIKISNVLGVSVQDLFFSEEQ